MTNDFNYTGERFADLQMLRYRLNGFESLSLQQKLYIYYLFLLHNQPIVLVIPLNHHINR